jgi:hypothetical protein
MGTLKGLGGAADRASGGRLSAAGQKIKSGVGRTMERLGLRKEGTTATTNAKRVEDEAKTMANEYAYAKATGDTAKVAAIQDWARKAKGTKGAAAMKVVQEAGDLATTFKDSKGNVDLNAARARLTYAESVGATNVKKEAIKSNPNLAGSPAEIAEATRKVAPRKAAEWDPTTITPEVAPYLSKNQMTEIGRLGSPQLIDEVKKYKYDPTKNLAGQSSEWIKARLNVVKSGPVGSPERIRAENNFAAFQKELATNANFA